jgi:hypothetical protein
VIGTPEYERHPFAGIVYCGLGHQFEQEDHFVEEQQQMKDDAKAEAKQLDDNQKQIENIDAAIESKEKQQEQA